MYLYYFFFRYRAFFAQWFTRMKRKERMEWVRHNFQHVAVLRHSGIFGLFFEFNQHQSCSWKKIRNSNTCIVFLKFISGPCAFFAALLSYAQRSCCCTGTESFIDRQTRLQNQKPSMLLNCRNMAFHKCFNKKCIRFNAKSLSISSLFFSLSILAFVRSFDLSILKHFHFECFNSKVWLSV